MFGEDFVDLLVKEINTYGDNKIQANGTIPKISHFINGIIQTKKSSLHF